MKFGQSRSTPLWAALLGGALLVSGRTRPRPTGHSAVPPAERPRTAPPPPAATRAIEPSDHGRQADSPAEIGVAGWKDIAYRIYQGISEDRIVAISAGVTFFVILALFPGIAGLISLYGMVADVSAVGHHLDTLAGIMPEGGTQVIGDQIARLTAQPAQKLGFATIVSLAISLWSANGGMKAMFDAMNVVYHEKEKRGFFRLNATSLALTFGAIAFVIVSLVIITAAPAIMDFLGLSSATALVVKIARWPLLLIASSFFIAVIYRFGPSRDKPKWRWVSVGSIFASLLWLAASLLFSWYAEHFGSYNKTYGSLGAAIGFMTWIWLSCIVMLVGAKINAETEHQTTKDTTEGHPQALGHRHAQMADTVGAGREAA